MTLAIADEWIPIIVVPTVFIGLPLAIGYARRLWIHADAPRPAVRNSDDERLVQMQQSIDAMAIEIERISEGQRFVTRVLAQRQQDAIGAGDAAAARAPGDQPRS